MRSRSLFVFVHCTPKTRRRRLMLISSLSPSSVGKYNDIQWIQFSFRRALTLEYDRVFDTQFQAHRWSYLGRKYCPRQGYDYRSRGIPARWLIFFFTCLFRGFSAGFPCRSLKGTAKSPSQKLRVIGTNFPFQKIFPAGILI